MRHQKYDRFMSIAVVNIYKIFSNSYSFSNETWHMNNGLVICIERTHSVYTVMKNLAGEMMHLFSLPQHLTELNPRSLSFLLQLFFPTSSLWCQNQNLSNF